MDAVLFIVGIFFLWKGSIKISKKTEPWPQSKKMGRIIGGILLIPLLVSLLFLHSIAGIELENNYKVLAPGEAYSNQQYGFKIIPPNGWMVDESKKNGQIIGFVDRAENIQSVIAVTSITDSDINSSSLSFDQYVENGITQARATPGVTFINSNKLSLSTIPAYLFEYKIVQGNKILHFIQLSLLAKNGQVYIISGVAEDAQWLNLGEVIKNSLMSFTLL